MTEIVLKSSERTEMGSAAARRLRRSGQVPCIVLGQGEKTQHLCISAKDLGALLRKQVRVVDLESAEGLQRVLIKDLQYDTYADNVEHVDFLRVVIGETLQTETALDFFGTPKGVTEGNGVLQTPLAMLRIECTPSQIPSSIEVDVRELEVGDIFRIKDLLLPEGVVVLNNPERVVASVSESTEEEEGTEVPESAAEPEVIGGKPGEGED